jgi:hypothetical protein
MARFFLLERKNKKAPDGAVAPVGGFNTPNSNAAFPLHILASYFSPEILVKAVSLRSAAPRPGL